MNRFTPAAEKAAAHHNALCATVVEEIEATLKVIRSNTDVWERAVLYEAALLRIRQIAEGKKIARV